VRVAVVLAVVVAAVPLLLQAVAAVGALARELSSCTQPHRLPAPG
jgi:hypothetical protein